MTQELKYLPLFQSEKSIPFIQQGSFRNFLFDKENSSKSNKKILKFSPQKIYQEIDKIEWRKKTEFPIVKILDYKQHSNLFSNNLKYSSKKILIQVTIQPILYNINEVDEIPLFKMMYILKQTLIAAERLCNLYGNFIFKSSMIGIDLKKKCKVWHNSKFYLNTPQLPCRSQETTIKSIIALFFLKTQKSPKAIKFYQQLQKCTNFCQCLNVLKKFSLEQKIRIPTLFLLVDNFSSNMCSPRKYISRPPSNQKNSSPSIQKRCKNNKTSPEQKINAHIQKSKKSPQRNQNEKKLEISPFKFKQLQYFSQKNISTSRTRATTDYSITLRKQNMTKIKQFQFKKINELFTPRNKFLGVIESVFEGDSDSRFSDDFVEQQPKIRVFEPVIQADDKQSSPPCRSSISMDQTNPETENHDCFISSKQGIQISNENNIQQKRKLGRVKTFHPSIRILDDSIHE